MFTATCALCDTTMERATEPECAAALMEHVEAEHPDAFA